MKVLSDCFEISEYHGVAAGFIGVDADSAVNHGPSPNVKNTSCFLIGRLSMTTRLKTLLRTSVLTVALIGMGVAQAGPHGVGGYRGGYYHHHHHGGGARWIAPAIIGGALVAAAVSRPAYSYSVPSPAPIVVAPPVTYVTPGYGPAVFSQPVMPQPVGYFCLSSGQFYPYVATCSVPWQLM
jgi:hypothetical protein